MKHSLGLHLAQRYTDLVHMEDVKFALEHATKTQKRGRDVAVLFL